MMLEEGLSSLLIVAFVALGAFFNSAKIAFQSVRKSRLEQLKEGGCDRAALAIRLVARRDMYLSACQMGSTGVILGMGLIGIPLLTHWLIPLFDRLSLSEHMVQILAATGAFLLLLIGYTAVSEAVRKVTVAKEAEQVAVALIRPLYAFQQMMLPLLIGIKGGLRLIAKWHGVEVAPSAERLEEDAFKEMIHEQELEEEDRQMVERIFNLPARTVKEIMIPRIDMEVVFLGDPLEENLEVLRSSSHSRFPVCGQDRDDVIGYLTSKDVFRTYDGEPSFSLELLVRPLVKVHKSASLQKVMRRMQKERHQLAVVLDEYGGVSGLVTIEDILEEIVGDIQDEFDDEREDFLETEHGILVDGGVSIRDFEAYFNLPLHADENIETLGGYVLSAVALPVQPGQRVVIGNREGEIEEAEGSRILAVRILPEANEENQEVLPDRYFPQPTD